MRRSYAVHICGDTDCPSDPAFEHRFYFGCVPKDFSERTGRSKSHRQSQGPDGRYRWNGGCDAAENIPANIPTAEATP